MLDGASKLLESIDKNIKNLYNITHNSSEELDDTNINVEVKHITGDMQSVLDYIAVNIHEKYCPNHNIKKIYYIYCNETEYEPDFIKKINTFFPGLYENCKDIYNEFAKTQWFCDNTKWLIILNDLANEGKHNDLYITKVKKERNILMESEDASLLIKGNMNIHKTKNGYGVFGSDASVYVGGSGRISFYSDGTISIGKGSYNIDSGKSNNISTTVYYENVIKSKKYNENIIKLLNNILSKEKQMLLNIQKIICDGDKLL